MTRKLRKRNPRVLAIVGISLSLTVASIILTGCGKEGSVVGSQTLSGPRFGAAQILSFSAGRASDVAEVMRVQNTHTPDIMTIPEVVGTATGRLADGSLGILVLTRLPGVPGVPAIIEGVRVESRVVGEVVAYARPGGDGPLESGTSAGNDLECSAGTIGGVVITGGNKYFLSNNHIFARENTASIGERIDAPGRYDGRPKCSRTPQAGTLSDFQAIDFSGGNNTIDCAIAQPISGLSFTCAEAGGYTPTSNVAAAAIGMLVKKTGGTTGLTRGTVTGVNVTINVGYRSGTATFTDQIMVDGTREPFLRAGDSGSLMVTDDANDPVGLCFAGSPIVSFANPIGPVLSRFSAAICSQ